MARKGLFGDAMGKDAFYFGHDINARNDVKMCALRREAGGWAAYGLVWALIEYSGEQSDYRIELDLETENWHDCPGWLALSEEFGIDLPTARKIIDCCLKNRLACSGLNTNALQMYLTTLNISLKDIRTKSFIFFPAMLRRKKISEARRRAVKHRWKPSCVYKIDKSLETQIQNDDIYIAGKKLLYHTKSATIETDKQNRRKTSTSTDFDEFKENKEEKEKERSKEKEREETKETLIPLREEETDKNNQKLKKPKEQPSPLWPGCEYFRMSEKELSLATNRFKLNKVPEDLLPFAIQAVDDWLAGHTAKAIIARRIPTHYRRLYAAWTIEKAVELKRLADIASGNGNGNGHKQHGRNYYPTAYERRMEREERLKLELAELDRKESEQRG